MRYTEVFYNERGTVISQPFESSKKEIMYHSVCSDRLKGGRTDDESCSPGIIVANAKEKSGGTVVNIGGHVLNITISVYVY